VCPPKPWDKLALRLGASSDGRIAEAGAAGTPAGGATSGSDEVVASIISRSEASVSAGLSWPRRSSLSA
jgi:hypothetical protein